MNELLANIFTAGKPPDIVADTHSRLPSRRHDAWLSLSQIAGKSVTIIEATGSQDKSAHSRGWGVLRRIQRSGGCIRFDSSKSGGLNNRAIITVARKVEFTEDCGRCTAAANGCPINDALARAHKYSRQGWD